MTLLLLIAAALLIVLIVGAGRVNAESAGWEGKTLHWNMKEGDALHPQTVSKESEETA